MTVDGSFGHNLMKQFLPRSSLENTPMIESGKFLAQLLQRVFRRTQKGAGDKRRNPVLISSSQRPSLHCRLRTRALAPLQRVLPALQHEGGAGAGGGVRRVCRSVGIVPRAARVSGDVCDESDTRLDLLPAQGARLQL